MTSYNIKNKLQQANSNMNQGLVLLQATSGSIVSTTCNEARDYLAEFYQNIDISEEVEKSKLAGVATIMKSIFNQKRVFFALTKDQHFTNTQIDPDNTYKVNLNWKRFICFLSKLKIVQLWDAKGRKSGGYVINDPDVLAILKLTGCDLKSQLNDLKQFTKNTVFDSKLVFTDVGELRVQTEDIRAKIEDDRSKRIAIKKSDSKYIESSKLQPYDHINDIDPESINQHSTLSDSRVLDIQNKNTGMQKFIRPKKMESTQTFKSFRRKLNSSKKTNLECVKDLVNSQIETIVNAADLGNNNEYAENLSTIFREHLSEISSLNHSQKDDLAEYIKLVAAQFDKMMIPDKQTRIADAICSLSEATCS